MNASSKERVKTFWFMLTHPQYWKHSLRMMYRNRYKRFKDAEGAMYNLDVYMDFDWPSSYCTEEEKAANRDEWHRAIERIALREGYTILFRIFRTLTIIAALLAGILLALVYR